MTKIKGYGGALDSKIVIKEDGMRETVCNWMPLEVAKETLDEGVEYGRLEKLIHPDDQDALRYYNIEKYIGRPMIVLSFEQMCMKMLQNVNGCKRFPPGDIARGVIKDVERYGYRCDSSEQDLIDRCREVYDTLQWDYLKQQKGII